ncbi:hypothetical protein Deipe_3523 [Deinococcus peraridilitoris DSM 19664]|uniref:Uncharacterized protein n=1 Tax=Deinococcus peraridilitoris (strain DSM 19664 / LMG 22246 / CIP 109416 / KR-200) TaxID=937777 RepID=L0A4Z0_DEIPD|nr:hypothetical protein Deipe_3523 [Deinococcus peraridilitoris DSM 19664]
MVPAPLAYAQSVSVVARGNPWIVRGKALATMTLLLLISFSPSVAWFVSRQYTHWQSDAVSPRRAELPPPPALTVDLSRRYAPQLARYERRLDALKISAPRRSRLVEEHFQLYRRAHALFGAAQAGAMLGLIEAETRNQEIALGRRSVFSSPEAALSNVERWLTFSAVALLEQQQVERRELSRRLRALAPVPLAPEVVFVHARWIKRAASVTGLPPAVLAAVVDTEQAGARVAYGLSGALRTFTDTAALRTTQMYGRSGLTGELSKTVGLTQMSWQDALGQQNRLAAMNAQLGVPFPANEAEARALLSRPYANLLLTASRIVGYLNYTEGLGANSVVAHTSAQVYYLGPGWHNNPALASSGQTWPYAWNAFFKACLYERLLR